MEPKEASRRWPRWEVATLAAWSLGVAVLLLAFSSVSIWYDELASIHLAHLDLGRWKAAIYGGEANGGSFHLTLRVLIGQWGDGPLLVRAPSIVAWTVGIPCFHALARRLASTWLALAATAAYSVMPLGLHHGREARMYAFAVTGAVAASLALTWYVERPTRPRALAYGLAAGFAMTSQFLLVFVVAAHGVALLTHPDRGRLLRRCWPGLPPLLVGLLPLVVVAGRDGASHVTWIPRRGPEETRAIIGTLLGLRRHPDWPLEPLLMLPALALVAAGVVAALRSGRRGAGTSPDPARSPTEPDPWLTRLVALWALTPIAALLAVSWLVSPFFLERYLIGALPGMVLLALSGLAWLLARTPGRPIAPLALAGLALLAMVPGVATTLADPLYGEDYRAGARAVMDRFQPGDLVLTADSSDGQLGARGLLYELPADGREVLAPALLTLRQLEDPAFEAREGTRVWVVSRVVDDTRAAVEGALDRLGVDPAPAERWRVAHLEVSRHDRPSD